MWTQVQAVDDVLNPSYLAASPDGRYLMAASENLDEGGAIHVYTREKDGTLLPLGVMHSHGLATCHVCVTRDNVVCAASYLSGSIVVYPQPLAAAPQIIQYEGTGPDRSRQEASHPHQVVVSPDSRWLYVPDLGADRIWIHALEAGGVFPATDRFVTTPAGCGPRHLVFHPTLPCAYLIGELNAHVLTCSWDRVSGQLHLLDEQPSLPPDWRGQPSAAAIRIHPSGKTLHVSNRNADLLTVFRLDGEGRCSWAGCGPSGGETPRDFAIDPSGRWLVAAHQKSNNIAVHELDPESGMPRPGEPRLTRVGTPVGVLFC